jgi:chromosome partitioning protein
MAKAKRGYDPEGFQAQWRRRGHALRSWLLANHTITIVDCPPSLALQVRMFLRICDGYVIPSVPDRISVRGARWLQSRLEKSNFKARPLGLAWTLYREQNERHKAMVGMMKKQAGQAGAFRKLPKPFSNIVPNATAIVRATENEDETPSLATKYTPPFAKLFQGLAREVLAAAGMPNARA